MKKINLFGMMAVIVVAVECQATRYANEVVSYQPGVLPGNLKGFTNITAVLGEPSRETPGTFGGPVDPFNPPYLNSQLITVGEGGSLTVRFDQPIENLKEPGHRFGLDFLVYGNAGFVITNGDYSGGGVTDGSLFGHTQPGMVQVLVSIDNEKYYALKSALAPVVDAYYPTDGSGSFGIPVDPRFTASDCFGQGLSGLRTLYGGSAGGAAFDLDWAVDERGQAVTLDAVNYLRIEVVNGHVDLDGFSAVISIPEPGTSFMFIMGCVLLSCGPLFRSR